MCQLYFLHGMESSPRGIKAQLLKKYYPDCNIPLLPPDISKRLDILRRLITRPSLIIGSSLGGLSALMFAMEKPELVKAMTILAPAVGFFDPDFFSERETRIISRTVIPINIPCSIIAGEEDDVIPLKEIRKMVKRSPDSSKVTLKIVKDGHSLNQSLDLLLELVAKMINSSH